MTWSACAWGLMVAAVAGAPTASEQIRATQLTLVVVNGRAVSTFRATLLARSPDSLTILTAAHCLDDGDDGARVVLSQPGREGRATGKVARVFRNPDYLPHLAGPAPGADNAIAVIDLDPDRAGFLDSLAAADLVTWPSPGRDGQVTSLRVQDQRGVEHAVRASNFSNPRWLEWGPAYRPIPGDSGSGMFAVVADRDGAEHPVLIGALVDRSREGGGGSLVCKRYRWVAQALAAAASPKPTPAPAR